MSVSPEKIAANKIRNDKIYCLHQESGLEIVTIAERMGMRRVQINRILKAAGVDTSRRKAKA